MRRAWDPNRKLSGSVSEAFELLFLLPRELPALWQRERARLAHAFVRHGLQLVFLVLAPSAFSGAFSGVKYLFLQIGQRQPLEATPFVLQLVALLAFTCLFGRFFCGYACAFGALGDAVYAAGNWACTRFGIRRPELSPRIAQMLANIKYLLLAGICLSCLVGTWEAVSGTSPWVAFAAVLAGAPATAAPVALVALAGVVLLMLLDERAFCHFLCPLGALFALMPVLPISQFVRTRAHCARSCGRCQEACPVDLWPDADVPEAGECISCGRCADVCPMANPNMLALERAAARLARMEREAARAAKAQGTTPDVGPSPDVRTTTDAPEELGSHPTRKTRRDWLLLRGNEHVYVLVKALLLLAVLWATGAVRYLPAPPWA